MKDSGVNLIRLALHKDWTTTIPDYLPLVDKIVELSGKVGIRVCLASMGFNSSNLFEEQWNIVVVDPTEYIDWWKTIIERYKNNPTVSMIDLFNEPAFYKHQNPRVTEEHFDDWYNFSLLASQEIHSVNPNLVISIEIPGFDLRKWRLTGWLPEPNIVYSFHHYYNSMLDYSKPKWSLAYQDGNFTQAKVLYEEWLNEWYFWVLNESRPIWCGETGIIYSPEKYPNFLEQFADELDLFDKYGVGFAQWAWHAEWHGGREPYTGEAYYMMLKYGWNEVNEIGEVFLNYTRGF